MQESGASEFLRRNIVLRRMSILASPWASASPKLEASCRVIG
jgi:hypothetical protein